MAPSFPSSRDDRIGHAGPASRELVSDLKRTVKQAMTRAGAVGTTPRQAADIIRQARGVNAPGGAIKDANELARQVKRWHTSQGDGLPFEQCHRIIAALRSCPGWDVLLLSPSRDALPDSEMLSAGLTRLKQFGYTAQAAAALITALMKRDDTPS